MVLFDEYKNSLEEIPKDANQITIGVLNKMLDIAKFKMFWIVYKRNSLWSKISVLFYINFDRMFLEYINHVDVLNSDRNLLFLR